MLSEHSTAFGLGLVESCRGFPLALSRVFCQDTQTHTHTNKRMKLIYSSFAGGGGSFLIQHPTLHRALLSRHIL